MNRTVYHLFPGRDGHHVNLMVPYLADHGEEMGVRSDERQCYVLWGAPDGKTTKAQSELSISPGSLLRLPESPLALWRFLIGRPTGSMLVVHSGKFSHLWDGLLFRPDLWKRTAFLIWGGELGAEDQWWGSLHFSARIKNILNLFAKQVVPRRIGAIGCLVPGDYEHARKGFGATRNYRRVFYPSLVPERKWVVRARSAQQELVVVVNNSAFDSNRHLELFGWLSHFAGESVRFVCPLPYGAPEYKARVIEEATQLFKDRFLPLELMPIEEYYSVIDGADVLVFNHKVQQGLFAIYCMLSAGRKVFLRSDCPTYTMLRGMGFRIFDTLALPGMGFAEFAQPLLEEECAMNRRLYREHLSEDAALLSWRQLFDALRDPAGAQMEASRRFGGDMKRNERIG